MLGRPCVYVCTRPFWRDDRVPFATYDRDNSADVVFACVRGACGPCREQIRVISAHVLRTAKKG